MIGLEEIISGIISSLDVVHILGYAITIGVWELTKLAIRKAAQINPVVYTKLAFLFTGIAVVYFAQDFAEYLHQQILYMYGLGILLIMIVVLPYLLKLRGNE